MNSQTLQLKKDLKNWDLVSEWENDTLVLKSFNVANAYELHIEVDYSFRETNHEGDGYNTPYQYDKEFYLHDFDVTCFDNDDDVVELFLTKDEMNMLEKLVESLTEQEYK